MFSVEQNSYKKWCPATFEELNTHKASFKYNHNGVVSIEKMSFENKRASLFISVGRDYHEQGKFLATIELVNKYPFNSCDIVICDTLQKHNHYGKLSEENAYLFTKEAGDSWLERNGYALNRLKVSHKIIRWDSLLSHPDYAKTKAQVMESYNNQEFYKEALDTNVLAYLDRLSKLNPLCDQKALFQYGLNYLLEECPILPIWAQMGYDFLIYPKPMTPGMAKTRELFVEEQYPDKSKWLYLRFRKR